MILEYFYLLQRRKNRKLGGQNAHAICELYSLYSVAFCKLKTHCIANPLMDHVKSYKTMEQEYDIRLINLFDVVKKQTVLPVTYKIIYMSEMGLFIRSLLF